ncbi:MAG: DUF1493 family protein [Spirochaetales bacterium]|nr:DUF1493 family protein [Spirochaetales bacterium]
MAALEEELFSKIREILVSEFDIAEDEISLDSDLVEDFDLDSIDAAELIVKFKEYLPPKVDASMFREIRTVRDLIELLVKNAK